MRRPIIGVLGGGAATVPPGSPTYQLAATLGRLIAEADAILLCGGGSGVMEAAAVAVPTTASACRPCRPSTQGALPHIFRDYCPEPPLLGYNGWAGASPQVRNSPAGGNEDQQPQVIYFK